MEEISNTAKPRMSPSVVLLLLLLTILVGNLLVLMGLQVMEFTSGKSFSDLTYHILEDNTLGNRNFLRYGNMLNQLLAIGLPAIVVILFSSGRDWATFFKLDKVPRLRMIFFGTLFFWACFDVANWSSTIDLAHYFPNAAVETEALLEDLTKALLVMDHPLELILNLITIAVLPAICEELLFRGVIQQQLTIWTKNPHVAIWIAAFVFSAFHFQFLTFLPRFILGAGLGYLFFFTQNLWVAIIGHFLNNGLQVAITYFYPELVTTEAAEISWLVGARGLFFVFIFGGILYFSKKYK